MAPREEEVPDMKAPVFDLLPEYVQVEEGETAKFMVKVSGNPRPRVSWWLNGTIVVNVSSSFVVVVVVCGISRVSSGSSSSSRNEYYLGGIIALLLQDHCTMSTKSVCSSQYMATDQH